MPVETEIPMSLWILLGVMMFFVLIIWIGQMRTGSRLKRIEIELAKSGGSLSSAEKADAKQKADENEQYLIFQEFLDEDPSRSELSKKEQFAAFRKWRREKGLTWSSEGRGGKKPA